MRTAILIDGGFLRVKLPRQLTYRDRATRIVTFARNCITPNEEHIYRIFYYDCPAYDGSSVKNPHPLGVSAPPVPLSAIAYQKNLLSALRGEEQVAVRCGEISFDGWGVRERAVQDMLNTGRSFKPDDFRPNLRQKGVDLKIGMDIAMLARDRLVERIVLVAGDSDFVPAMKLARREGIQIVLVSLGHGIKPVLKEHADFYRQVHP